MSKVLAKYPVLLVALVLIAASAMPVLAMAPAKKEETKKDISVVPWVNVVLPTIHGTKANGAVQGSDGCKSAGGAVENMNVGGKMQLACHLP